MKPKTKKTILFAFWLSLALFIASIVMVFSLISNGIIGYIPEIEELQNPKNKFASEIYTSDGEVLGRFFYGTDNRVAVRYQDISPYVVEALLATEDVRFFSHSGIDSRALARAIVLRGLLGKQSAGGGSTITQQLAKLLYSPRADNLFERALQKPIEWVIAVQLERYYAKEEIIAMYLNQFDFLNNAVGIKSAAQVYFNVSPMELTREQAALLVGMCKNPSYFNPNRFKERATNRRNTVINQLYKYDYIVEQESDSLQKIPLELNFQRVDHKLGLAPYFREYLRQTLMADEPRKSNYSAWQMQKYKEDSLAWKTNPAYGWCKKNKKPDGTNYNVYTDGLRIYTTIDARMQRYAEEAVKEHLGETIQTKFFKEKRGRSYAPFSRNISSEEMSGIMERAKRQSDRYRKMTKDNKSKAEIDRAFATKIEMNVFTWNGTRDTIMSPMDSIKWQKHFLRCGFMSMDPYNGHVKAYVGGPNFAEFQYDMVTQGKRQVGSTIKPYLYTLAMEEGLSPCQKVPNMPQTFYLPEGKKWTPRNASTSREGELVTLRWGLANSNNWISAYLMKQVTPQALVRMIHSFGIQSYMEPVVSLCLGPADVSVKEMVGAYTAFPNKGIRVEPLFVTRIEDNKGNVLATFTPQMYEIFSEETSYKMLTMLGAVINEGTGVRLRYRYNIKGDIGGKTGTTQNNSDGWFIATTPQLVGGVWVGGEDRSIHFDNIGDGQGANTALPIWAIYMKKVYADTTLPYSENASFKIPTEYKQQFDCRSEPNTEESFDQIFDLE
ncbi:MAG: transglycosylase domain-containing protein [Paludibacteraceae bacterium]|nr:transglycosylase domain-containing protein [Paludibacteraceae bacterium]MBP6284324.1 transglycosylase domain-containing protein [Paludibacteraceae bacterium]